MANQFRDYCLTINNPTETDDEFVAYLEKLKTENHLKYAVFQREIGEKKKTIHFQIYLEFTLGKRFETIKQYFSKAHIEQRRGSKEQARTYCMKEKKEVKTADGEKDFSTRISPSYYEVGEFVEIGERSDISDIIKMVQDGATDEEIKQQYPSQYFRYYKNIQHIRQLYITDKFRKIKRQMEVTYLYGKTGVGKTTHVTNKHGYENVYVVDDYKNPFDLYENQDVILFDEFRSQFEISKMLRWLDIHPLVLPARYNNKQACYTKVYITSNIPLESQYIEMQRQEPETWRALLRRIHNVIDFDKLNSQPPSDPHQMTVLELTEQEKANMPF